MRRRCARAGAAERIRPCSALLDLPAWLGDKCSLECSGPRAGSPKREEVSSGWELDRGQVGKGGFSADSMSKTNMRT